MAEFTPITTQEQLDATIEEHVKRERENIERKYEGFLSPEEVSKKYGGHLSPEDVEKKYEGYIAPEEAAKKDAQIKNYENKSKKMRIAHEMGLSYEAAAFITGDSEDAIRKSAESLKNLVGKKPAPPLADSEPPTGDAKDAALRNTLRKAMKGVE